MVRQLQTRTDITAQDAWRRLCRTLRPSISSSLYRACFTGTEGLTWHDDTLVVTVPNLTIQEQMQQRFLARLTRLAIHVLACSLAFEFVVSSAARNDTLLHRAEQQDGHTPSLAVLSAPQSIGLKPQFTFETFIVGDSNRFAFAGAQSVANQPGQIYNPLFLYGGVGLGKTHLMMAIGHAVAAHGARVYYVTSETFTHEILHAVQTNTQDELRARYREVDLLLVDDIQFIGGKERTEEEFFHTFNALHTANKQIVVTSDRPPRAIPTLHDRLRSRFEWGLLADVSAPEYEHRLAIVQAKAATLDITIPPHALEYLARPDGASVRNLEGALNHLAAGARIQGGKITMAMVAQTLRECFGDGVHLDISPAVVVDMIAHYYRLPSAELLGKGRSRNLAWPRQVAMYLLREETQISLAQIGDALGGRDHTTIMHGCDQVVAKMRHDEQTRQEVTALRTMLHNL